MLSTIAVDSTDLHYSYELQLAGASCNIATNSRLLGDTLRMWYSKASAGKHQNRFTMKVVVTGDTDTKLGSSHFRGLNHLVFASFGSANTFIFDLEHRTVVATVSERVACDSAFWNHVLLPIAMGVLGAAIGVVPVHCACLSIGNIGLLIAGESGAGKSTLALALAREGFQYISDDWTYLSHPRAHLIAHGLSVPVKLLPDAVKHFPELAAFSVHVALNQELAYEVSPRELGLTVGLSTQPQWFFFLERSATNGCSLIRANEDEALQYLEAGVERLPDELCGIARARSSIVRCISQLSCWRFRYSGAPQDAARNLREFLALHCQEMLA